MDAIAVIGVSQTSIRVVLTAERIVYAGKWKGIPTWIEIGRRDMAYRKEFEVLTRFMHLRQIQNEVRVYENCGKGQR